MGLTFVNKDLNMIAIDLKLLKIKYKYDREKQFLYLINQADFGLISIAHFEIYLSPTAKTQI